MNAVQAITAWLRVNRAAPGSTGQGLTPEQALEVARDVARGVTKDDFVASYLELANDSRRGFVELAAVRARALTKAQVRQGGASQDGAKAQLGKAASRRRWHELQAERGIPTDQVEVKLGADTESQALGWRRPVVDSGAWGVGLACGHTVQSSIEARWLHCPRCRSEGRPSRWKAMQVASSHVAHGEAS